MCSHEVKLTLEILTQSSNILCYSTDTNSNDLFADLILENFRLFLVRYQYLQLKVFLTDTGNGSNNTNYFQKGVGGKM